MEGWLNQGVEGEEGLLRNVGERWVDEFYGAVGGDLARGVERVGVEEILRIEEEEREGDGEGGSGVHQPANVKSLPTRDAVVAHENVVEETVRNARATFGDHLPRDFLNQEEYALYERLYGPPARDTGGDDFEALRTDGGPLERKGEKGRNVLLRENGNGEFEEVDFDPSYGYEQVQAEGSAAANDSLEMTKASPNTVQVQVKSQRELDAILRLQRDMDAASARPVEEEEEIDEEVTEEEENEAEEEEEDYHETDEDAYLSDPTSRSHPLTIASRSDTFPSTIQLPHETFVTPITELLARANHKHLVEAAERAFGGPGLPHSPSTPPARSMLQQKHIGLEAAQGRMSEIEADAYLAGVMPGTYASVMSVLVEVRKRLGTAWMRDLLSREGGPRVLDAGAGGAGIVAWREIVGAEWEGMRDDGVVGEGVEAPPVGKATVLTGATSLRHRVSRFLDETTFLPRLPDYVHSANSESVLDGAKPEGRKVYDVIIAPHMLFPLKEEYRRKHVVHNLWSMLDPNGGVLILLEKGLPRGFEAVAAARQLLLKDHIQVPEEFASSKSKNSEMEENSRLLDPNEERKVQREQGMIIAPCTNHAQCPMYKIEGLNSGRKDFCHFKQRYERPQFLQRVLGAKSKNHEDVGFSYLAVRRGVPLPEHVVQGETATLKAFEGYEDVESEVEAEAEAQESELELQQQQQQQFSPLSLPRAILPALKRRGHVTLDLCTSSGTLERWTVPKSFSSQAYRDARKLRWGDLWALGAKTRVVREARIGKGEKGGKSAEKRRVERRVRDLVGMAKGGKGAGKRGRNDKDVFEVLVGEKGMEDIREVRSGRVERGERRTKGGRLMPRERKVRLDEGGRLEDDEL